MHDIVGSVLADLCTASIQHCECQHANDMECFLQHAYFVL